MDIDVIRENTTSTLDLPNQDVQVVNKKKIYMYIKKEQHNSVKNYTAS